MTTHNIFQLAIASAFILFGAPYFARGAAHQTLDVGIKDPVVLDLVVAAGDVRMTYSRDGELGLSVSAHDAAGKDISEEFLGRGMAVQQDGPRIWIRTLPDRFPGAAPRVSYQIDVPYRTQVNASILGAGNLTLIGITGPAVLTTLEGNIEVADVIHNRVEARTGKGKISCVKIREVDAETGSGNIVLMEDGPSRAVVKSGFGAIEAAGTRGSLIASTDKGDVHVKAVLYDAWQLTSGAGNVRIEMPPKTKFNLDADTVSGVISVERDDMQKPASEIRELHQQVNGDGSRVSVHSTTGNIFIQ
jgi:Putative adhesin